MEYDQIPAAESARTWQRRLQNAAIAGAAATALAFELSPFNEVVRGTAAFSTLEAVDSNYDFLAAGGVVGAVTLAVEMGTSALVAAGLERGDKVLRKFTSLMSRFRNADIEKDDAQDSSEETKSAKFANGALAMTIGSALVVTKEHLKNPKRTLRQNLQTGLESSAFVAGVSAVIGALATGGSVALGKVNVEIADHELSLQGPSEWFVERAVDWKFWLLVFGGLQAADLAKRGINRARNRKA